MRFFFRRENWVDVDKLSISSPEQIKFRTLSLKFIFSKLFVKIL